LLFNIDYTDSRQNIYKLKNFDISNAYSENLNTGSKTIGSNNNKHSNKRPTLFGD